MNTREQSPGRYAEAMPTKRCWNDQLLKLIEKWEAEGDYPAVDGPVPEDDDEPRPNLFEVLGMTNTPVIGGRNVYKRILIRRVANVPKVL